MHPQKQNALLITWKPSLRFSVKFLVLQGEETLISYSRGLASYGDSTTTSMDRLWTIAGETGVLRFHGRAGVALAVSDRRNARLLDLMSLATASCYYLSVDAQNISRRRGSSSRSRSSRSSADIEKTAITDTTFLRNSSSRFHDGTARDGIRPTPRRAQTQRVLPERRRR